MPEKQLFDLINEIHTKCITLLDSQLEAQIGINYLQVRILQHIAGYENGLKQEELAGFLAVDKSTISRQLRSGNLVNLIIRKQSKFSARENNVKISSMGKRKLAGAEELTTKALSSIFKSLNKYEQKQFQIWLRSIASAVKVED